MITSIIAILGIIWFLSSFVVTTIMATENKPIRTLINKLFENRNTFGKILSFIALILCIPSIVLLMLVNLLLLTLNGIYKLWTLGNTNPKKEKGEYNE